MQLRIHDTAINCTYTWLNIDPKYFVNYFYPKCGKRYHINTYSQSWSQYYYNTNIIGFMCRNKIIRFLFGKQLD